MLGGGRNCLCGHGCWGCAVKPNLHDLDALIKAAQELKRAQQSFERKSAKARDAASMKASQKASADMHWDAMHVERCWDTLHAKAVDLGLTEAKAPGEYAPRVLSHSGWHEQKYQPALPRSIRVSVEELADCGLLSELGDGSTS